MDSHQSHLCRAKTEDGLSLDGILLAPNSLAEDFVAFLIVHGTGSNFYAPGVLEVFADAAVESGHVAHRVNTRGHDLQCSIPSTRQSVRGGASFERVSECVHDIDAWVEFLVQRGCPRVVLVGHSMGGVKAAYFQAQRASAHVKAVVCISPPRFSHQHWVAHPNADAFRESYETAVALMNGGNGHHLIQCRQPLPLAVTAEGFVDKYGPSDNYDLGKLAPELKVPLSVLVGEQTVQSSPAFDSWPAYFESNQLPPPSQFAIIPDADMNYSRNPREPFDRTLEWLEALRN
jgi:pimeloyl-ACP methyl ester carboxylesterase